MTSWNIRKGFNSNILETWVELITYSILVELNLQMSGLAVAKLWMHSSIQLCLIYARAWSVTMGSWRDELYKVTKQFFYNVFLYPVKSSENQKIS